MSLAGRVLAVARDQPYEQAIHELLLESLGMTRATFFADGATANDGGAVLGAAAQAPGRSQPNGSAGAGSMAG